MASIDDSDNKIVPGLNATALHHQSEKHYQFDHDTFRVVLTDQPLNILDGINFVKSLRCGAINTFSGTVRDTDLRTSRTLATTPAYSPIIALEYEAYCPLAFKQLIAIVKMQLFRQDTNCMQNEKKANIPVMLRNHHDKGTSIQADGMLESSLDSANNNIDKNAKIYLGARLGVVSVGQEAIIICVSSTSRHFSHSVTMKILQNVKTQVAIWKKILFSDGTYEWASGCKS